MTFNNAVDATQQGVQYISTTGQWSGSDGGAAGQVLTSNGPNVQPTFQAATSSSVSAFSANHTTTDLNATGDGTIVTVIYNVDAVVPSFNVGGNYNPATGEFTAPITGKYFFEHTIPILAIGVAHTTMQSFISINGVDSIVGETLNPFAAKELTSGSINSLAHGFVSLTAGDVITSKISVSGGAKTVTIAGGGFFGGWLVTTL